MKKLQKFRLARDQPRLAKKKFQMILEQVCLWNTTAWVGHIRVKPYKSSALRPLTALLSMMNVRLHFIVQELKDNRVCCKGTLLWLPSAASDAMVVEHLRMLEQQKAKSFQQTNTTKRRQPRSGPSKKRLRKHKASGSKPDGDTDSSDSEDSYMSDYDDCAVGAAVVATPFAPSSTGLADGVVATPSASGRAPKKDNFGGLLRRTSARDKVVPCAADLTAFHIQFWKNFSSRSSSSSSQSSGPHPHAVTFMDALGELPLGFLLKHGPRLNSHERELLLSCALNDSPQPEPKQTFSEGNFSDVMVSANEAFWLRKHSGCVVFCLDVCACMQ